MKTSEKTIEKRLFTELKKAGGWCIKIPALHIKGIPDRLCLLPGGVLFFAELKTTGLTPSKIQMLIHSKLKKLGFKVYVIDNISGVLAAIDENTTS